MFRISADLLPLKLHFLLYNSAQACYLNYMSVAGKQAGISASYISWIFGIAPLASAVLKILAGYIADRIQNLTALATIFQIVLMAFVWGVFLPSGWASDELIKEKYEICPVSLLDKVTDLPKDAKCELFCGDESRILFLDDPRSDCNETCRVLCNAATSSLPLVGVIVYSASVITTFAVGTSLYSISDTICYEVLGAARSHLYGQQRLWGTVGWGIVSTLIGIILDATSPEGSTDFTASVIAFTILIVANLSLLLFFTKFRTSAKSSNIFKDLEKVFSNVRVLVFSFWVLLCGILIGVVWTFSAWLLTDLNASKTLIGISFSVQSLFIEVPMFFLAGHIIKYLGHFGCMTAAFVCFAVKFIGYGILSNPWYAPLVDIVGGAIFPLFYAALTAYASICATPGIAASLQCIFGAIFEGIGMAIGNFLGAQLISAYGSQNAFLVCGVVSITCAALCALSSFLLRNKRGNSGAGNMTEERGAATLTTTQSYAS